MLKFVLFNLMMSWFFNYFPNLYNVMYWRVFSFSFLTFCYFNVKDTKDLIFNFLLFPVYGNNRRPSITISSKRVTYNHENLWMNLNGLVYYFTALISVISKGKYCPTFSLRFFLIILAPSVNLCWGLLGVILRFVCKPLQL